MCTVAVIDMVRFCWILGSHRTPWLFIARQQRLTKINICRWAFCVWWVVWEPPARWIVLSEKMFFFLFKKKIWISEAPLPVSLDSTRINQSGKEIISSPQKINHISAFQTTSKPAKSLCHCWFSLFLFFIFQKIFFSSFFEVFIAFVLSPTAACCFLYFFFNQQYYSQLMASPSVTCVRREESNHWFLALKAACFHKSPSWFPIFLFFLQQ